MTVCLAKKGDLYPLSGPVGGVDSHYPVLKKTGCKKKINKMDKERGQNVMIVKITARIVSHFMFSLITMLC